MLEIIQKFHYNHSDGNVYIVQVSRSPNGGGFLNSVSIEENCVYSTSRIIECDTQLENELLKVAAELWNKFWIADLDIRQAPMEWVNWRIEQDKKAQ